MPYGRVRCHLIHTCAETAIVGKKSICEDLVFQGCYFWVVAALRAGRFLRLDFALLSRVAQAATDAGLRGGPLLGCCAGRGHVFPQPALDGLLQSAAVAIPVMDGKSCRLFVRATARTS